MCVQSEFLKTCLTLPGSQPGCLYLTNQDQNRETYGGQLAAIAEIWGDCCPVVLLARETARNSFGPCWEEVPLPDVSSQMQAFPELEPFQLLREAGLLPVEHKL